MERNPTVRIIPAKEENIRIEKVGIYARVSTAGRAQLRSHEEKFPPPLCEKKCEKPKTAGQKCEKCD
jgi:hypothetical protein